LTANADAEVYVGARARQQGVVALGLRVEDLDGARALLRDAGVDI